MLSKNDAEKIVQAIKDAGREILTIYEQGDFDIEHKADQSPLTRADRASHHMLNAWLCERYPDIPVFSEEGTAIDYETRKHWKQFWLLDPLDGTKEFIKRNGEFTVNLGLIRDNHPVAGFIHVPCQGTFYCATETEGAYKIDAQGIRTAISVDRQPAGKLVAVRSRSHATTQETDIFERVGVTETLSVGSSLKFCRVAEGAAHLYLRFGPTWEWDTAAGQALVETAGGVVQGIGEPLRYNKPRPLNSSFYAAAMEMHVDKQQ